MTEVFDVYVWPEFTYVWNLFLNEAWEPYVVPYLGSQAAMWIPSVALAVFAGGNLVIGYLLHTGFN